MSFETPLLLLALLAIPLLLAVQYLLRRRRTPYEVRLPSVPVLAAVLPKTPQWRRHVPVALACLALASLVVALAKPQRTVSVPVERAAVQLVMDASGSMDATDVSPTRLDATKRAANTFLDEVPDELRVGVLSYSDGPGALVTPTQERPPVRATLESLQALGGTATGDALTAALDALKQDAEQDGGRRPPAAIILLSDGKTSDGADPVQVAQQARKERVPIYTVALGTDEGTVPGPTGPIAVPPDQVALRQIAETSGGQAFQVTDADGLQGVYDKLGSQLGSRKAEREVTWQFAGLGALLLVAAVAAGVRFGTRVP